MSRRLLGLVVLATIAAALPTVTIGYLSDDHEPMLLAQQPAGWRTIFTQPVGGNVWRPLGFASLLLDATLWQETASGPHLTSVLLHAINAALLAALVASWSRRPLAGVLAGLLFGLYPARHEAVTWLSGRFDLLATVWLLMALWFFEQFLRGQRRALIGLFAAATAGFLTKETAFALPLLLAWRALVLRGPGRRRPLLVAAATLIPLLGVLAARAFIVGDWLGGYTVVGVSITERLGATSFVAWLLGPLRLIAGSLNVGLLRAVSPSAAALASPDRLGWVVLVGLAILCWRAGRTTRSVSAALLLGAAIALLPNLPVLSTITRQLEGTRFWYAAAAGSLGALGCLLADIQRPRLRAAIVTSLLIAFASAGAVNGIPWRLAGREARAIEAGIHDLAATLTPETPMAFTELPDNRYGAYVFRRGFGEWLDRTFPGFFRQRLQLGYTDTPTSTDCAANLRFAEQATVLTWESAAARWTRSTPGVALLDADGQNALAAWAATTRLPSGLEQWRARGLSITADQRGVTLQRDGVGTLETDVPNLPLGRLNSLSVSLEGDPNDAPLPIGLYWRTARAGYAEYQRHLTVPIQLGRQPARVALCQYTAWLVSEPATGLRLHVPSSAQPLRLNDLHFSP